MVHDGRSAEDRPAPRPPRRWLLQDTLPLKSWICTYLIGAILLSTFLGPRLTQAAGWRDGTNIVPVQNHTTQHLRGQGAIKFKIGDISLESGSLVVNNNLALAVAINVNTDDSEAVARTLICYTTNTGTGVVCSRTPPPPE